MITFEQQTYIPHENESVLDCLLRHGVSAPYSCRNGVCQTCLMRATKGSPTAPSQKGLKQTQVSQNFFLACACIPQNEIEIVLPDTQSSRHETSVLEKTFLSDSVLRLRLSRPENFSYFAGQFLTIFKTKTIGRSYSLASVPDVDQYLEFHIHIIPGGQMSPWLANDITVGDTISVSEALGSCIYIDAAKNQPLLLIGTGTGMAPLIGIARQALLNGHQLPIKIYHGSRTNSGLYLDNKLKELAFRHENIEYFPCVTREKPERGAREARASDMAIEDNSDLKNYTVYLCGNADMVNNTKRKIFLAGVSLQNIHADPFIHG